MFSVLRGEAVFGNPGKEGGLIPFFPLCLLLHLFFPPGTLTMALPDVMRAALVGMDPDLLFQLNEFEIPLLTQYNIRQANYNNVRQFTGIEDSRAAVRTVFQTDFALDPTLPGAAGIQARRTIAALVGVWEILKDQTAKESQIRAESRAMNIQRPLGNSEKTQMRRLVEALHGKLPSSEIPSAEYLASKAEQVELDEPYASPLDEITSLADTESQTLTASLSLTGSVQIVHKKGKIAFPDGPEQFRMRMRVEAHTWMMLAAKYPNRAWLVGTDRDTFFRYVDFFLGSKVMLLKIPFGDSTATLQPQWKVVLNYELECRRYAFELVRDSVPPVTLMAALMLAIKDSELKEVHFTSPIALGSKSISKATVALEAPDARPGRRARKTITRNAAITAGGNASKGGAKGSKGKGSKGKGKGKGRRYQSNTVDGRQICFSFNSAAGCPGDCGRVRVCSITGCQEDHSAVSCPKV